MILEHHTYTFRPGTVDGWMDKYRSETLIPKTVNIDPFDRNLPGLWRGASGELAPAPQADRNDVQSPCKSGLRCQKIAPWTALHLLPDEPHRPSRCALPEDDFHIIK